HRTKPTLRRLTIVERRPFHCFGITLTYLVGVLQVCVPAGSDRFRISLEVFHVFVEALFGGAFLPPQPNGRPGDLAATKGGGAFTCGTKIGVDSSGVYYVEDVKRSQWSADGVRAELRSTAVEDGQSVRIHWPQDPGQAGKDQAEQLAPHLAGFNVKA